MPLHLPPSVEQALKEESLQPKCPAASMGKYADSGNRYVRCAIERVHFAVNTAPTAVLSYCANEDGYTECPSWVAEKSDDPIVKRTHEAQKAAYAKEVEKGLRMNTPIDEYIAQVEGEAKEARDARREREMNE